MPPAGKMPTAWPSRSQAWAARREASVVARAAAVSPKSTGSISARVSGSVHSTPLARILKSGRTCRASQVRVTPSSTP